MKTALITGITGQDSVYLAQLLLDKGYKVYGTFRRASTPNFWRIMSLGLEDKIDLISVDLGDMSSMINALQIAQPDEVYNMAASSYVADSFECPLANLDITGIAVERLLESIRIVNKDIRFYQSSSSEMFGNHMDPQLGGQYEDSYMKPISPYGVAKLAAHHLVNIYREGGMYAISGILFNHESPLRGLDFVTRKISNAVAKIKLGLCSHLRLGNLYAHRDWGYAPEYMEAVWLMMQQDKPDDYVVATDISHTVLEFATVALKQVGLDIDVIVTDPLLNRPIDIKVLRGYSDRTREKLPWAPKTFFGALVKLMVDADLKRWQDYLDGKHFPWDAYLYPNEAKVLRRINN